MNKIVKIPDTFQRVLWSYNLNKVDIKKNKEIIITQVLNYGTWEDVKKLFVLYSERDIKNVIIQPRRGVWFEKVLNFWIKMFRIKLKKEVYEKAVFKAVPI